MNILKKYWTIIPLFLFGYLFIRNFIISYEEEFIFEFEVEDKISFTTEYKPINFPKNEKSLTFKN